MEVLLAICRRTHAKDSDERTVGGLWLANSILFRRSHCIRRHLSSVSRRGNPHQCKHLRPSGLGNQESHSRLFLKSSSNGSSLNVTDTHAMVGRQCSFLYLDGGLLVRTRGATCRSRLLDQRNFGQGQSHEKKSSRRMLYLCPWSDDGDFNCAIHSNACPLRLAGLGHKIIIFFGGPLCAWLVENYSP